MTTEEYLTAREVLKEKSIALSREFSTLEKAYIEANREFGQFQSVIHELENYRVLKPHLIYPTGAIWYIIQRLRDGWEKCVPADKLQAGTIAGGGAL